MNEELIKTVTAYVVLRDNEFMGIFTELEDARKIVRKESHMTHQNIWIEERTLIV